MVTPGVALLCRGAVYLSIYVGSVYYGASQIVIYSGVEVPKWLIITGALVAAPTLGRLYVALRDFRLKRRASALGARVVPKVRGTKIGNLDVVERTMKNTEMGYVGTFVLHPRLSQAEETSYSGEDMRDSLATLGQTFNLNIMYSDLIFTTSPEHVKLMLATDFQNFVKGTSPPCFQRR